MTGVQTCALPISLATQASPMAPSGSSERGRSKGESGDRVQDRLPCRPVRTTRGPFMYMVLCCWQVKTVMLPFSLIKEKRGCRLINGKPAKNHYKETQADYSHATPQFKPTHPPRNSPETAANSRKTNHHVAKGNLAGNTTTNISNTATRR